MKKSFFIILLVITSILVLADDYQVVYSTKLNLDSDRSLEHITLKGEKVSEIYWGNFLLSIEDDGKTFDILTGLDGYSPKIEYFDFNGDGYDDILLTTRSGGSGNYINYALYLYTGDNLTKYNIKPFIKDIKGFFMDQYKAVISYKDAFTYLDLSDRKKLYQEIKAYDQYGRFIKNYNELMIGGFSELEPFDFGNDGTYELKGSIAISGLYHADSIGYLHFIYSVKKDKLLWLEVSKTIYVNVQ
ncbi:hypothetical protein LN42_02665 [Marinitoga sp. 1137]|uniref:hypothetical protein n=1 Tax=Marinitoga sp. 1137 TaxID=1545835 RepID=UPI00095081E0|nr:hypothetical protein [Marinitoga sp. 1137]APT75409.1 hypothetical protein LN42_02665 [Marinitoga sp. 1137]